MLPLRALELWQSRGKIRRHHSFFRYDTKRIGGQNSQRKKGRGEPSQVSIISIFSSRGLEDQLTGAAL